MYTLVPFRRTVSAMPSLFNDHFMREFFDVDKAPDMRVDIRESENGYMLEAELPGVEKENISLNVENGVLTVSADIGAEKKEEKDGYVFSERRSGHVERSFNMEGIDVSAIKADYQNGVLKVSLPKEKVEEKNNTIHIAIGDDTQKLSDGE